MGLFLTPSLSSQCQHLKLFTCSPTMSIAWVFCYLCKYCLFCLNSLPQNSLVFLLTNHYSHLALTWLSPSCSFLCVSLAFDVHISVTNIYSFFFLFFRQLTHGVFSPGHSVGRRRPFRDVSVFLAPSTGPGSLNIFSQWSLSNWFDINEVWNHTKSQRMR